MQQVLDVFWERLLPALDSSPRSEENRYASEARLAERLAALALPILEPGHDGPDVPVRFVVETAEDNQPLRRGTELTVSRDGSDYLLTFGRSPRELIAQCGRGQWLESRPRGVPVVSQGGWTEPSTFEADMVLIETPHRIRLRGNGSRLDARWNTAPLFDPALDIDDPGAGPQPEVL
jgi:hypothetical protein